MAPQPTFHIDRIEAGNRVVGRNGDCDLPAGTVFTSLRRIRVDGDTQHLRTVDLGQVATVRLVLRQVHWYGRTLDYVPAGHTAGVDLEGEGIDAIEAALSELTERESLVITAEGDIGGESSLTPDR